MLLIGLLYTLIMPKLAISSMGIIIYGQFATILGICLIPLLAEMGLTPGLTREIGKKYSQGLHHEAGALTLKFQYIIGGISLLLSLLILLWLRITDYRDLEKMFFPVLLGCSANIIMTIADIGLIIAKIKGKIVSANINRSIYYVVNLTFIVILYFFGQLSITIIFAGQFIGACIYYLISILLVGDNHREKISTSIPVPWRGLVTSAVPEQINRIQSSLLPGIERSIMLNIGGPTSVSAYDIALRLSGIVTSVPSFISQPLLPILSSRLNSSEHDERVRLFRHTNKTIILTSGIMFIVAIMASFFWAVNYYNLRTTNFVMIAFLIFLGSGVNVLTTPWNAILYAHAMPGIMSIKSIADTVFAALGILCMILSKSIIAYIGIRYLCFLLTSGMLIYYCLKKRILQLNETTKTESAAT